MDIRNLKITVKLAISAAAFLLPLGIMLFSIISISLSSIKKDQKELNGIEVIRPAISLMQIIPQHIRFSVDNAQGDLEFTKQHTAELINDLQNKYTKYFSNEITLVSMQSLTENWNHLENTKIRDTVLWAYKQIMQDLTKLIIYVGDISGLITDSDIESAYLIAAAIHELPQAQERMVLIGNILRTIQDGAFTQRRRSELQLNLELLTHSDNARIQNRYSAVDSLRNRNTETLESFEVLLKGSFDRIAYFSESVDNFINNPNMNTDSLSVLYDISAHANNAAFRLQDASLDRLKLIISSRIKANEKRFFASIFTALFASAIAFSIIIAIVLNIRRSTKTIINVFDHLDKNDLSVQIQALSKDELGSLMTALSGFLQKLNIAFISFNKNAYLVSSAVLELSSSSKEITATAHEQSASVSEIVSTMENNKNLSAQSSEKTVEVALLAEETQMLSRRGADLRDINEEMMLDIRNQNTKIIEIIKNLAEMLSRIDESIQLIDTIADKTKLLAFNAALEASSSGEAGNRFSVVAGEIRRFANNVVDSAAEIKEQISEILEASQILTSEANNGSKAIDTGYKRMVEQKEVFENIVNVSHKVATHSQQISSLSKQQELASVQVFSALKEISAGVNQFVSATSATSDTLDRLNSISMELKETLNKYNTTDKR